MIISQTTSHIKMQDKNQKLTENSKLCVNLPTLRPLISHYMDYFRTKMYYTSTEYKNKPSHKSNLTTLKASLSKKSRDEHTSEADSDQLPVIPGSGAFFAQGIKSSTDSKGIEVTRTVELDTMERGQRKSNTNGSRNAF